MSTLDERMNKIPSNLLIPKEEDIVEDIDPFLELH